MTDRAFPKRGTCAAQEKRAAAHQPEIKDTLPPFWLALLPIVVVIASNLVFIQVVLPRLDTSANRLIVDDLDREVEDGV